MMRQFDFEKIPVVEVVNEIMVDASKRGASDIHFDPLDEHMKIRIRIDGILHNYAEVPNSIKKLILAHLFLLSKFFQYDSACKYSILYITLFYSILWTEPKYLYSL